MSRYFVPRGAVIDGREWDRGEVFPHHDLPVAIVPGDANVTPCRICGKQFVGPEDAQAHIRKRHARPARPGDGSAGRD